MIIYGNNLNLIDRYTNSIASVKYRIIEEKDELINSLEENEIVIVSNINLALEENLEFVSKLVEKKSKVIVLDSVPTFQKGSKLVALGIKAYANFMINDVHLKDVIENVKEGNIWLYPEFINQLVSNIIPKQEENNSVEDKLEILTEREKEVALLVLDKLPYAEISEKLDISVRTVKAHTKHIYEKFDVSNRLGFILKFHK